MADEVDSVDSDMRPGKELGAACWRFNSAGGAAPDVDDETVELSVEVLGSGECSGDSSLESETGNGFRSSCSVSICERAAAGCVVSNERWSDLSASPQRWRWSHQIVTGGSIGVCCSRSNFGWFSVEVDCWCVVELSGGGER